jgi:formate hydrogenlyase transcriptional activator
MRIHGNRRSNGSGSSTVATLAPSLAGSPDPYVLLRNLASRLRHLPEAEFRTVQITLYGSDRGEMLLHVLDPPPATATTENAAAGVTTGDDSPVRAVWRDQQPLLISVSSDGSRFPTYVVWMREVGLESEWVVPVSLANSRLGAIGFGSTNGLIHQAELSMLQAAARELAATMQHILNLQEVSRARGELARERDRSRLLLEINNALVSKLNLNELWEKTEECLLSIVPHEFAGMALYDKKSAILHRIGSGGRAEGLFAEECIPAAGTVAGLAFETGKPVVLTRADVTRFPSPAFRRLTADKWFGSGCMLPLISHDRRLGIIGLVSRREGAFGREQMDTLTGVAAQISIAVENALTHHELEALKNTLRAERQYLDEEVQTACDFDLIGNSEAFLRILRHIEIAAPTDSTILIQGETGTGKELIALAIHRLSARRERTLVKVNCSAIPTGLLESELFGHEKGAFTGAIARRTGRFELAHQGTLFLDEVGDIPRELQPKLLRVLQEKEFERIGSSKTLKVDVRLVAATNADLPKMVAEKEFRSDLYYRLNVFPITVPPLRERPEDILPLAQRFAQTFARRMKKPVEIIPQEVAQALTQYHWPGNIRELQNVIERAVILSRGRALEVSLSEFSPVVKDGTLAGTEREYIIRILRETNWIVSGKNGAASRLGLNRSTLQSRMRKLGINRPASLT